MEEIRMKRELIEVLRSAIPVMNVIELNTLAVTVNGIFQIKNTETASKGFLKVVCKGGEEEYILLHDRAKESLKLYLDTLEDKEILWLTHLGIPAKGTDTLRTWVNKMYNILKKLDNSTPYFTPHSFRHTMIENLQNGSHYICKKLGRALTAEEIQVLVHHKKHRYDQGLYEA